MARIDRWLRKPPPSAGLRLKRNHPLAPDRVCVLFGQGHTPVRDLARRLDLTPTGGASSVNRLGMAREHTASTDKVNFVQSVDSVLGPDRTQTTIIFAVQKTDATFRARGCIGDDWTVAQNFTGALLPYSDQKIYWDWGAGGSSGTDRLISGILTYGDDIFALTTGPRGMEIWQNGQLVASGAQTPTRPSSSGVFTLGNYAGLGSDLVRHGLLMVYNRQLAKEQIIKLTYGPLEPFQVVEVSRPLRNSVAVAQLVSRLIQARQRTPVRVINQ